MLVINGFFENGIFIPEKPLSGIEGRQKAVLRIDYVEGKQDRIDAWKKFSKAIRTSNEVLEGEPARISFKTPEEIASL